MNFKHDLLLVDLETTGLDSNRQEIIQLAAVLLDKKTLKEKRFFNVYVKPARWQNRNPESMKINKLDYETLKNAQSLKTVIKKFSKFANPKTVTLSYYGGPVDIDFLRVAYEKCRLVWQFDYHYFNLWACFFVYLAAKNQLKQKNKFAGFSLEQLIKKYKIRVPGNRHDGLYDCRIEAEILRKIISEV